MAAPGMNLMNIRLNSARAVPRLLFRIVTCGLSAHENLGRNIIETRSAIALCRCSFSTEKSMFCPQARSWNSAFNIREAIRKILI